MNEINKKRACKIKRSKPAHVTVFSVILAVFLFVQIFYFSFFQSGFDFVVSKISNFANVISSVLVAKTNDYRALNVEKELIVSDVLNKAAQMKAEDMAKRGYFSHLGPEGEKPWSWFDKVNYEYIYAGENLAIDFTESEDVVNAWINSAKHQANLLNVNFTEIGIGIADGIYEGRKTTFVVQFFASPFVENKKIENENILTEQKEQKEEKLIIESLTNIIEPTVAIVTRSDIPDGAVLGTETNININKNIEQTEKTFPISIIIIGVVGFLTAIFWKVISNRKKTKKE